MFNRKIYEVQENVYGLEICEFSNGMLTTAGLTQKNKEVIDKSILPITYIGECAEELPITYHSVLWTCDDGIDRYIDHIDFDNERFIMKDGYVSTFITGYAYYE